MQTGTDFCYEQWPLKFLSLVHPLLPEEDPKLDTFHLKTDFSSQRANFGYLSADFHVLVPNFKLRFECSITFVTCSIILAA